MWLFEYFLLFRFELLTVEKVLYELDSYFSVY